MRSRAMPAASHGRARADEEIAHLGDDVVVVRRRLHRRAARPACASGTRRRRLPRTASSAPGAAQRVDVVDHRRAGAIAARITAGLRVSTDTGDALARERLDHRQHARAALLPRRPAPRPAASTRRRRRSMSAPSATICRACASAAAAVEIAAAVGKRIGRDVDDAHDERARRSKRASRRSELHSARTGPRCAGPCIGVQQLHCASLRPDVRRLGAASRGRRRSCPAAPAGARRPASASAAAAACRP